MTNALPLESVAIANANSAFAPLAIRATHKTAPVEEYLAMNAPLLANVALLTPLASNTVDVVPLAPPTNTLPDVSVAIPYPVLVALPVGAMRAAHRTVPTDEYLAMKQGLLPAVSVSVAPTVPLALDSVNAALYPPVINTLSLESVATALETTVLDDTYRAAHDTLPDEVYLIMKPLIPPGFTSDVLLTPLELYIVSVPLYRPSTITLPLESVAIAFPLSSDPTPAQYAAHLTAPAEV